MEMETEKKKSERRIRLIIFIVAGILHLILLIVVVFPPGEKIVNEMSEAVTIRLTDIDEVRPPPPQIIAAPPPPAYSEQTNSSSNTVEAAAENMIETDELLDYEVVQGILRSGEQADASAYGRVYSQSSVTSLPVLPENRIRGNIVYPRIALSSGIEGYVILELFIDSQGNIINISIIQENPENRGFGEAAINALNGIKADTPAKAEEDNRTVAVRYRYPIRFTIR